MSWKTLLAVVSGELDQELARQIDFLKAENKILKRQVKGRIRLNDTERRTLAEVGKPLGRRILGEISTIVTPDTILRWHRRLIAKKFDTTERRRTVGRPPTPEEIRELVLRAARENPGWGYTRIGGALKNLGHDISRSTIKNILTEAGIEPSPERLRGTSWHDFIATHKDVLAATDFFTQEVWQYCRLVTFYVLFFIHIGSRRVHIAVVTPSPDHNVMEQVAREVTFADVGFLEGCKYLIHDRDTKFTKAFDGTIESVGIEVIKLPRRSPNLNAFAERWVRSIKSECLDRLILFGERSLRYAIRNYLSHYHGERPHQGLDNSLIDGHELRPRRGEVQCRERLGGLLKFYFRHAAEIVAPVPIPHLHSPPAIRSDFEATFLSSPFSAHFSPHWPATSSETAPF